VDLISDESREAEREGIQSSIDRGDFDVAKWFFTSAKTGEGVDDLFLYLAEILSSAALASTESKLVGSADGEKSCC
jgi:selenocysteine-specific translation elongation factor